MSSRSTPHHTEASLEPSNKPGAEESDTAITQQEPSIHVNPPIVSETDYTSGGADEREADNEINEIIDQWDLSASWDCLVKDAESEWFRATQAMSHLGKALEDLDEAAAVK